jgi:ABC-2 type transport system permease protein
MRHKLISWFKIKTVIKKELTLLLRDKVSLVSILIIPVLQVILYGFVLNSNPKHMPMAVVDEDRSVFSRTIIKAFENSQYYKITHEENNVKDAEKLLDNSKIQFFLFIPSSFSHDIVKGRQPHILFVADAINNMAAAGGINTAAGLESVALNDLLKGVLKVDSQPPPFKIIIEQKYNPTNKPQYYTIPGVMCLSLAMIMLTMTLMSVVQEKEHNTMESLLTTPTKPIEIMLGKIAPFVCIVYLQLCFVLVIARLLFAVPFVGSYLLLLVAAFPFIISSLFVGLLFSTMTSNQYQAAQIASFYVLPNFLFSGFIFPFYGMPKWAQILGEIFPLTHFLRIVNGIMIKGNNFYDIIPFLWPLILILLVLITITTLTYKQTLD